MGAATLGDGRLTVGDLLPLAKVATLKWEKPLIVEGLRLWNGDQTAGGGFISSARVRELEIKTGAVGPTFTLEDLRSEQSLSLPQSGLTTTLALVARSAYPGVVQKTPVMAELQLLAGGEAWIPFDQKASTKADQDRMAPVIERGWIDIFDRELVKDDADNSSEIWRFRFRSDGTFFAESLRIVRDWLDLGRCSGCWELVAESPAGASGARGKRALVMRLNGSRFVGAENWDSLPCGATLPISSFLARTVGISFMDYPIPATTSPGGIFAWALIVIVISVFASLFPALRASRLTVNEVLAYE